MRLGLGPSQGPGVGGELEGTWEGFRVSGAQPGEAPGSEPGGLGPQSAGAEPVGVCLETLRSGKLPQPLIHHLRDPHPSP